MPNIRKQIENPRDRAEKSDEISHGDSDLLREFSDRFDPLRSEYTDHRHNKLLRHYTTVAETPSWLADVLSEE